MVKDPSQKIAAFKELLKIAEEGSFDVYATSGDIYGTRAWPVECFEYLWKLKRSKKMARQEALDRTLMKLTRGDFPETIEQMQKERHVIHLTLLAGANPNTFDSYYDGRVSAFQSFWDSQKAYGLLELVQDDRFEAPNELQKFYENFYWDLVYCGFSDAEYKLYKQKNQNKDDLIYALFQKNMYPTNPKVFEKLVPAVLEKDPQFFDKKKQVVQQSLVRAKTPVQIYNVLIGRRKEKN